MPSKKRKSRSKTAPDFVKKKQKVGKKTKEALSFKSRSVVVPTQLEVALGPTTHRKQNFQVLQAQLNHHNATVRCDALLGLHEMFVSHPEYATSKLPALVERVFPCTVDLTATVRQAACMLLRFLANQVSYDVIKPFFPAIISHLQCGLTHIDEHVQLDSVKLVDIYIQQYSSLVSSHVSKLVPLLINLLSRQTSDKKNAKPSKFQFTSLQSVPSSNLLKLDSRLKIMDLLSKVLQMMLSSSDLSSSNEQSQKLHTYMVDLSKQAVFPITDIVLENDKTNSSICHLSGNVPYIPILHSYGIVPDSTSQQVISNTPLSVSSHFDDQLDVAEHLSRLMIESWMEVVPTYVFSMSSPSIQYVTFMNKLLEILNVLMKLLKNYCISSYHVEKEKLSKAFVSIKAGISSYVLKYFPFSISRSNHKGELVQLEHSANFMFCNILGTLRLIGLNMPDEDDTLHNFVLAAAHFLRNVQIHHVVSSQCMSIISQISADTIPIWCQLSDEKMLGEQEATMIFDFILRLYNCCHPQSSNKQKLVRCLCEVFMKKVAKRNEFGSSVVFKNLLLPWSSSLMDLLSDRRGISTEVFSVVIDAMATAVQHGNTAIIPTLSVKLDCVFGSDSYLYQASITTQRKALELLWYVPTLEASDLNLLGKFAADHRLDSSVIRYLIQIIHHKLILDKDSRSILSNLPKYLHFMFTILLGWCHKESSCSAICDSPREVCNPSDRTDTCKSMSICVSAIQQTISECISSSPLQTSDVLHCLKATLHHKIHVENASDLDDILNDKKIEAEAKWLLGIVDK